MLLFTRRPSLLEHSLAASVLAPSLALWLLCLCGCNYLFPSGGGEAAEPAEWGYDTSTGCYGWDVQPVERPWEGKEGGSCYWDGSCNPGLTCDETTWVCGCPSGTLGCPCLHGALCVSGLECKDGTCAQAASGFLGAPCRPDGTCDPGLLCTSLSLCLDCEPGALACKCLAGKCAAGLVCSADDVCVDTRPLPGVPPLPGWNEDLEQQCSAAFQWDDVESAESCPGFPAETNKLLSAPIGVLHWNSPLTLPADGDPASFVDNVRWCSGVLISGNRFLTSASCLSWSVANLNGWTMPPDAKTPEAMCADMHVDFNYQVQADTGAPYPYGTHLGNSFPCEAVEEIRPAEPSYAVLLLKGCPGQLYPPAAPAGRMPQAEESVALFHHPQGMPKAASCGTVEAVSGYMVTYPGVSAHGGSAGGGLFTADGRLAAVHAVGGCPPETSSSAGVPLQAMVDVSPLLEELLADPLAPRVDHVWPGGAQIGQPLTLRVTGVNLPGSLAMELTDCIGMQKLDGHSTRAHFQCTPSTMGPAAGRVLWAPDGAVLSEFAVDVLDGETWCAAECQAVDCGEVPGCACEDLPACTCGDCGPCGRCVAGQCEMDCDCLCTTAGLECGMTGACDCGACEVHHSCTDGKCTLECDAVCLDGVRDCGTHFGCECGDCQGCTTCCQGRCVPDCSCECLQAGMECGPFQDCSCGNCAAGKECVGGKCQDPTGQILEVYWSGTNCIASGATAVGCARTAGHLGHLITFTLFDDDAHGSDDEGPTFAKTVSHEDVTEGGEYVTCFFWGSVCGVATDYCVEEANEGDEADFYFTAVVEDDVAVSGQTWSEELNVGMGFTPTGTYCHW